MKYSRSLVATLLMSGGLLNSVAPAFAQTVPLPAANSEISNTATATYTDPADLTNTPISTVSNTVAVTVAKIAGIVVTPTGFAQDSGVTGFQPGQTVYSNFKVTNTGNDGVQFKVPRLADVGANNAATNNVDFVRVEYFDTTLPTPAWVPVTSTNGTSQTIAVNGELQVRVVVTIKIGAASQAPIVTNLGNTASIGASNVQRGANGESTNNDLDIYTVDVQTPGGLVTLGGDAKNFVREASATQTIKVNAVKQTLASVTVTNDAPTPNATTPATKDDVKYNFSVLVPTVDSNNIATTALAPTAIKLATAAGATTGADVNRVIISDPLTTGTVLKVAPVPPTGWTVVYAITSPDPLVPTVWSTVAPDLTTVKQVGFIYEPTVATTAGTAPVVTGTSLPTSTTPYTGFSVTVITPQLGTQAPNVVSISGATPTGTPVVATGNVAVTTTREAVISTLYNGPQNSPEAGDSGNDNNKDFTNKSIIIAPGDAVRYKAGDTIPAGFAVGDLKKTTATSAVSFSNTIANKTNVAGDVYVLPTAPAVATDLPDGTIVIVKNDAGTQTRAYSYTAAGGFVSTDGATTPLKLAVGAYDAATQTGGRVGYAVEVTLPVGQAQLKGYPVPMTAFAGVTPTSSTVVPATVAVDAKNTTIDKVYTGYINLLKEARLLNLASDLDSTNIQYVSGAAAQALKAEPGKFIQYRIRAINIADAVNASTGSKTLSATNLNVKEDGLLTPNTWGNTTSHAPNSAKTLVGTTPAGTISYDQNTKDNTLSTVSRYDANFGTAVIVPGQDASFSFVRQVNNTPPTPIVP